MLIDDRVNEHRIGASERSSNCALLKQRITRYAECLCKPKAIILAEESAITEEMIPAESQAFDRTSEKFPCHV